MNFVPDLSVVIPIYNRGELMRYTFESLRRAAEGLAVETIVVDDGSSVPVAETLARLGYAPTVVHRQENRGLLFARLAGLERVTGRHVLFLDSDDLVGPKKLRVQLAAMTSFGADVSYTDTARCVLEGDYDSLRIVDDEPALETVDAAEFYIRGQPPPHSPLFRTDYLKSVVADAYFPPSPLYNNVAEIWFYHNAAPRPARVRYVPGPHTIVGGHPQSRLTNHWERLGISSLAVMEAFARSAPRGPSGAGARRLVGEKAFRSWRALPRGFSPEFCERELNLWRRLAPGLSPALGGGGFQKLSRLLGPEWAAKLLRRWQAEPYASVRTLPDSEFRSLLGRLPLP